jgi:hypothetical protein
MVTTFGVCELTKLNSLQLNVNKLCSLRQSEFSELQLQSTNAKEMTLINTLQTVTLPAPALEHLCDLAVTIAPPVEIGQTPAGLRRLIPITGGIVRGPRLNGQVLSGGADFQLILTEGSTAHLDARYVIEADDGSRIFVQNTALRFASIENSKRLTQGLPVDPADVYFRCQPKFEATTGAWHWLNESQFIGVGKRAPNGVYLSFYRMT